MYGFVSAHNTRVVPTAVEGARRCVWVVWWGYQCHMRFVFCLHQLRLRLLSVVVRATAAWLANVSHHFADNLLGYCATNVFTADAVCGVVTSQCIAYIAVCSMVVINGGDTFDDAAVVRVLY